MQTTLHAFHFDISKPEEKAAWQALKTRLKASHPHLMKSAGGGRFHYDIGRALDGATVTLETDHLFDNQWNTAPIAGMSGNGLRLFDWAIDAYSHNPPPAFVPANIRQGYYLEQTPDMREARRNTDSCGYCGFQAPAAAGNVFCPKCLGSPYLKEADLRLTRMIPVDSGFGAERPELSPAEAAHLLPLYHAAQVAGPGRRSKAAADKARADALAKYERAIRAATVERDGMLYLLDRGLSLENVIFYSHSGRFSFGWRGGGLDPGTVAALLDHMSDFPAPYEIKCSDGRTLSHL